MIPVYLGRDYSVDDPTMRWWCHKNVIGQWAGGVSSAQILNFNIKEVPWLFERDEEATAFLLRWQ